MIDIIKNIDQGARCKHRTFRTALRCALLDMPESELKDRISKLDNEITSDERFRRAVREAVRQVEQKAK